MTPHEWHLPDRVLHFRKPLVMGIVNVTPDSFSDGGRFATPDAALARARELIAQGADILDIGGESTRPGSQPISLAEELARVVPVVQALAGETTVPLSVDTSKAEVAKQCLQVGAHIINDVTALTGDTKMADVVREHGAGVIVMHMQGAPATMQVAPHYDDVVAEIRTYLQERLHALEQVGIAQQRTVVDPGIGFGKTFEHNREVLSRLPELQTLGRPVCLGVSRKGFLGKLLNRPLEQREAGSLAVACLAMSRRAVQLIRVHEVAPTRDAVDLFSWLGC